MKCAVSSVGLWALFLVAGTLSLTAPTELDNSITDTEPEPNNIEARGNPIAQSASSGSNKDTTPNEPSPEAVFPEVGDEVQGRVMTRNTLKLCVAALGNPPKNTYIKCSARQRNPLEGSRCTFNYVDPTSGDSAGFADCPTKAKRAGGS